MAEAVNYGYLLSTLPYTDGRGYLAVTAVNVQTEKAVLCKSGNTEYWVPKRHLRRVGGEIMMPMWIAKPK